MRTWAILLIGAMSMAGGLLTGCDYSRDSFRGDEDAAPYRFDDTDDEQRGYGRSGQSGYGRRDEEHPANRWHGPRKPGM